MGLEEVEVERIFVELRNNTLDDVAAVIGFSATLRLAAWFGDGTNVYIPETVADGQVLAKLIGLSAAKKLTQEWGGQHLALPRLRAYEDDLRKRLVGRMLEQNFGTREISVHVRISERRVQQIARELEAAGLIDVVLPQKAEKIASRKLGIWEGLVRE
jgi:hypothetical protein